MRKEKDLTISAEGRDKGKIFHIREMSAYDTEMLVVQCFQAAAKNGINIPLSYQLGGAARLTFESLNGLLMAPFDEVKQVLDKLMTCVTFKPDPKHPSVMRELNIQEDIEEVSTLFQLKSHIWEMHTGFFIEGSPSNSTSTTDSAPKEPNS